MSSPIHTCPRCDADLRAPGAFCAGVGICLLCGADLSDELVIATTGRRFLGAWVDEIEPATSEVVHRDPGAYGPPKGTSFERVFVPMDPALAAIITYDSGHTPGAYVTRRRP